MKTNGCRVRVGGYRREESRQLVAQVIGGDAHSVVSADAAIGSSEKLRAIVNEECGDEIGPMLTANVTALAEELRKLGFEVET
jgi:hypothetical protein